MQYVDGHNLKNIIYGLLDPITNEIRYVGKSTRGKTRYNYHCSPSTLNKSRLPVHNWIKSLRSNNLKPKFKILAKWENISNEELNAAEIKLISEHKNLLNLSKGGDGNTGLKHTEEFKAALIIRNKNRKISKETKDAMRTSAQNRTRNKATNMVQISDGRVFNSSREAALAIGCSKSHMSLMTNHGLCYNGLTAKIVGKYINGRGI